MEDSGIEQTGFSIKLPKTKNLIRKSINKNGRSGYMTDSLRMKFNKMAIEHYQEPIETAKLRHRLYQEHWVKFKSMIKNLEEEWHEELVRTVLTFIRDNGISEQKCERRTDIPIGILVTDSNSDVLETIVREATYCMDLAVAKVSSNKCPNVKTAFQNIAKQLIQSNPNVSRFLGETQNDDTEENLEDTRDEVDCPKNRHLSIYDLNVWHSLKCPTTSVVLIFEDIDVFPENVIKNLLILLSHLNFQFILLLGIKSVAGFGSLNKYMPSDLKGFCKFELFSNVNPKNGLDTFMNQALLNLNFAFLLSGETVNLMKNYFDHNHFSISRLLQACQFCLMEHFRKPESVLCYWNLSDLWASDHLGEIKEADLRATLEFIPNFSNLKILDTKMSRSPRKSPIKKPKAHLLDFEETKKEVQHHLKKCYSEVVEWYESFIFFFEMGKNLPEAPIGKTKHELYISAFNGSLHKCDEELDIPISPFDRVLKFVQHFSMVELEKRVGNVLFSLKAFHDANSNNKLVELRVDVGLRMQVLKYFNAIGQAILTDQITQENVEVIGSEQIDQASEEPSKTRKLRSKSMKLTTLQENLMKKIQAKKVQVAPAFVKVRDSIALFLSNSIRQNLKDLSGTPFIQIFTSTDPEALRNQLIPNVEKKIHLALSSPVHYLHCKCCEDVCDNMNGAKLPDTSIIYKIVLEQANHIIDLNDLFQSFRAFNEPVVRNKRKTNSKKNKNEEDEYIIRFGQAIDELEFLGIIERSIRKPDEAKKLTWMFS